MREMIGRTLIQRSVANIKKYRAFSVQASAQKNETEWDKALPYEKIPGPTTFSLIRDHLPGGKFHNIPIEKMHKALKDQYGDLVKLPGMLGRKEIVVAFDPVIFEKVFRTEGIWPGRRGLETFVHYRKNVRPDVFVKTGGLLTEDGEKWSDVRSQVNPVLLQPKTVRMYIEKTDQVVKEFVEQIRDIRDPKTLETPNTFGQNLKCWSLESIGLIALDERLGVLKSTAPESRKLVALVNEFFSLTHALEIAPSIWKYYKSSTFQRLMDVLDEMTKFIMKYVDNAMQRLDASSCSDRSDRSVLEKLLKINRELAIVMVYDMIMAGVDTTSSALTSCLYHLAKNPDKQDILRKEILKILPDRNSKLSNDSLNNIPYLRACLKEAMRINPIVVGTMRALGQNLVLNGFQVPKGTDVAMSMIVLQKSNDYFPDFETFNPERWLKNDQNELSAKNTTNSFVYLPFGFGPRSCIGRRFAEMEIFVALTRILREFKIEYNHGPLQYKVSIILAPDDDLKFKFIDLEQ